MNRHPSGRNGSTTAPEALDLGGLAFESLENRPSKVTLQDMGRPLAPGAGVGAWLESLPPLLGAASLKRLALAIARAHEHTPPRRIACAIGGHVIKTGCGPYLIDWINRGILTSLALNGAAAIHDLELAIAGKTSEDVGARLLNGQFGFARETSDLFASACDRASRSRNGLGQALGEVVIEHGGPGLEHSVLVAAARKTIPLTVHVAIGADIVHMNPDLDGAALGRATLDDFRLFTNEVAGLAGGVWLNIGSAVVMPEVFLKAVSIVRNLGRPLDGLTAANLDFDQKYRGMLNVLERPGAHGIALTGHHEILIPLLHAAVADRLGQAP